MRMPSSSNAGPNRTSSTSDASLDFVVVDVETACSRSSSICQIGIVGFRDGLEVFAYETLVDPCDEFNPFNTRIHGITPEQIMGQPTFAHIHPIINQHLGGRITVAHSSFDKTALASACLVHEQSHIEATWLDSVKVAKRAWPHLTSHRLNALSQYLGIQHKHHDALSDARAAGMVIVKAIDHTGVDLASWLTASSPSKAPAPKAAPSGPLKGERIAIVGAMRDGALGHWLAAAGARVVNTVGSTTTKLVVSKDQPFDGYMRSSLPFCRAVELRAAGSSIEIILEDELRARITPALVS